MALAVLWTLAVRCLLLLSGVSRVKELNDYYCRTGMLFASTDIYLYYLVLSLITYFHTENSKVVNE
ncbi:MAG: hypothetical protein PHC41_13350 [Lachnospiraceae bacterium]|nr:hypothetical protein [Lachnospiraceae bacterium]MDD3617191.1 hypothetical protein [Lachnospiraceae bacterium]